VSLLLRSAILILVILGLNGCRSALKPAPLPPLAVLPTDDPSIREVGFVAAPVKAKVPSLPPAKVSPCPRDLSKLKTPRLPTEESKIEFLNNSRYPVDVVWVDFSGELKKYKTLLPNEDYNQSSFVGHLWLLKSATGQCLGMYSVTSQPTKAVAAPSMKKN